MFFCEVVARGRVIRPIRVCRYYTLMHAYLRATCAQQGQLLNALQREEARANKVSGTVRKTRHVRKKLLARIKNPRWEVKHHYHMTCMVRVSVCLCVCAYFCLWSNHLSVYSVYIHTSAFFSISMFSPCGEKV